MEDADWLVETARSFMGRPERPVPARDPVCLTRSRMFVEAIDDRNPIYTDHEAAREAGHVGLVAPPAQLQAWTMPGLGPNSNENGPTAELYRFLDKHELTGLIAVSYEQDYRRYLRPGDLLTAHAAISAVGEPKRTWLGEGLFVSTATEFRDQNGERVGSMTWTVFKYRPMPRAVAGDRRVDADTPELGLPTLAIPVTATVIVAGALATNDYAPIHHDVRAAKAGGFADIFPNIITTCGLVNRYVTDWAGPAALLQHTEYRLGVPCYPGDTLTFTGHMDTPPEGGTKTVRIVGNNERGVHVHGSVTVQI